ncbi:MAG: hypothetical protein C4560_06040 [Nitrospiraceae bacterium]|nr:MAG: hypothetical protein C4560_06040 [Nitrospiraceae bacterium]
MSTVNFAYVLRSVQMVLIFITYTCAGNVFANECIKDDCINGHGVYLWNSGKKYEGEWKDGKRHGRGTLTYADKARYEGEWKNDRMHGQGSKVYPDGSQYMGEWKNGNRDGNGTMIYHANSKYVGQWKNGLEHGYGTVSYKGMSRVSRFAGEWNNGEKNGKGTVYYPEGTLYITQWRNNSCLGEGKIVCTDGRQFFLAEFKDKKLGRLGPWREKMGYSLEQIGDYLDFPSPLIGDWENGTYEVPINVWLRLKCLEGKN